MRLPSGLILVAGFVSIAGVVYAQAPPTSASQQAPVSGKTTIVHPQAKEVTRLPDSVAVTSENAPQALGFESDVYCFGYLGALKETFPVQIHGAESLAEQVNYITDDLLYIDGGIDKKLKIGDEFWLVTAEQEVFHPLTGKSIGRFYQYRGRAVVHSVEARTGIVRVTNSCTDIPLGTFLKPFEPVPIPLARKSPPSVAGDPPSGKARGRIVFTQEGLVALASGHVVIVDLGLADGLSAGDFVTLFRYTWGEQFGVRPVGSYWVSIPPPAGVSVPRTYLGEGAVLLVGDRWSVVRLTDSFRMVGVGDEVELK
jgi:hypothetical protein